MLMYISLVYLLLLLFYYTFDWKLQLQKNKFGLVYDA
jgi:hypothetical protein